MLELSSSNIENRQILSILVRHEMELEAKSKAEEEETGHSSFPQKCISCMMNYRVPYQPCRI
ncbi:MAG: hypothetical protein Ct9H300mP28_36030 [Pseudomonadota bacterium]|nr:MAG: hypothetical protein Ct9H300mP28_36030 [Pseudomonadota bacterium]